MSEEQMTNNQTLALVFAMLAVSMMLSMGLTLGAPFAVIGLPFFVLSYVFYTRKGDAE